MSEQNKVLQNEDELFRFIDNDQFVSEKITAPRYSYWKSVFRVFFRKKINIVVLVFLVLILLISFVMPIYWPYDPMENVTNGATYHMSPNAAMRYFGGFSFKWLLGSGGAGNSILYGIISSSRISLLLAIICAAINMTIGILMGALWGYSKKVDSVMLVIYNIVANVPYILLITVLVYIIGSGFWPFVFALTVTGWLPIAYFFRTQVMIIRDREYSLASRCLGTPVSRVITKNILPFLTSVIVTLLASELPSYIGMEVFLSFIGIGLSATVPSLGRMIQQGQSAFLTYPWEFWPPVAVASAITIILYVLGQNLADASDPRTHM
ncbi:MAG: ABC transporter permease [Oscillospiraceae bacterium]|jgi:ABC-type dipeptide/oligopeptide/nickel transport systems, permease components|nr:ABC transporter permease [Clostridia bacterium]MBQ5566806.1 ABC transporter permease [Oscillospiraceae bacterium]